MLDAMKNKSVHGAKPRDGRPWAWVALRRGFTLVELLVVIAIIGVLIALLLPAVQAAREAARRSHCINNVKQIALAFHLHHDAQGFYPSSGWYGSGGVAGFAWWGVPEQGFGKSQPGAWCYSILPFIEQQALFEMGRNSTGAARQTALFRREQSPVPSMYCPTRRSPENFPFSTAVSSSFQMKPENYNATPGMPVAKSDYAANGGTLGIAINNPPPSTLAAGKTHNWAGKNATGITAAASEFKIRQVSDGTSKTYMVGEKYVRPEAYNAYASNGDDNSAYHGYNSDIVRFGGPLATIEAVTQDTLGLERTDIFGGPHAGGFVMGMCDGSGRIISYDIDKQTHFNLSHRSDGTVIDPKSY
jgi:prepilin-type N-terminal cleavage/methylation domain-containing protein